MKLLLVMCGLCAVACAARTTTVESLVDDPEVELPESMTICSRDDPELNQCIQDSITKLMPELHKGIPALGVPSMDPFTVENGYFEYRQNQLFGSLNIKNGKTYGMSRALIKGVKAKASDDTIKMEIDVFFPRLYMEGNFKGEGRFNQIKVASKGYFNITFSDVSTQWKIVGHLEERNGEQYMRMDEYDMSPTVGDMKIFATGLFPDPGLNRVALEFVNQYWPVMYREMLPETKKSWEPIMLNAVNKLFLRVPYRRLLPKSQ